MEIMNEIKDLLKELVFTTNKTNVEPTEETEFVENFDGEEQNEEIVTEIKAEVLQYTMKDNGMAVYFNPETGEVWTVDGETSMPMEVGIYELEEGTLTVTEKGFGQIVENEKEEEEMPTEEEAPVENSIVEEDKFESINERLVQMEAKYTEMESKFEALNKFYDVIEKFSERIEGLNTKVEKMSAEPVVNPIDLAPKFETKVDNKIQSYIEQAKRMRNL